MTEIEALEKSLDMWIWLYKNPDRKEADYFKHINEKRKIKLDCFLCEYDYNNGELHYCITHCPGNLGAYVKCFKSAHKYLKKVPEFNESVYKRKCAAAYIASKIRRRLRKIKNG